MSIEVRRNTELSRYELTVDGELGGIADYRETGGVVILPHTEIVADKRGKGLALVLVREALDDVRRSARKVEPRCWYVAEFIQQHPEYGDLLST